MADKKVTELTAITRVSGDDLLLVVNDPLGTPASRKVTLSNFFANVSVDQVYTAESTFKANTTFSGTKVTMNANLLLGSTNVLDSINDRMQVANTTLLVNDRLQMANVEPAIYTEPQIKFTALSISYPDAFTWTNGGTDQSNNQTLYLYRGQRYLFANLNSSHQLELRNLDGTYFSNGQVGNGQSRIVFTVPMTQQSNLLYSCTNHPSMNGSIVIV